MNFLADMVQGTAFFHSLAFGFLSMVIVGGSWCLLGWVMGEAPKRHIGPELVQFYGALTAAAGCALIVVLTDGINSCSPKVFLLTCGAYFLSGGMNFAMLQVMSRAMQSGPNGLIWTCVQSSPIIASVTGGCVFFGEHLSVIHCAGVLLLLLAMGGFGLSKDNSTADKHPGCWKRDILICVLLCAVNANITMAPSYSQEARAVGSVFRAMLVAGGTAVCALLYILLKSRPGKWKEFIETSKRPQLWRYVAILQLFEMVLAFILLYPGMNVMADHGCGGFCYPLLVGASIVFFTLMSLIWLKEKITLLYGSSLVLCFSGLILLCLKH